MRNRGLATVFSIHSVTLRKTSKMYVQTSQILTSVHVLDNETINATLYIAQRIKNGWVYIYGHG